MAEYENALFIAKLSIESHDCRETACIDDRKVGEIEGHDTLLSSSEVGENRSELADGREAKLGDRTKRRLYGCEVHACRPPKFRTGANQVSSPNSKFNFVANCLGCHRTDLHR